MPERVQLSRVKGWRMPPNTVKVDRSTRWGNPFVKHGDGYAMDARMAVDSFAEMVREHGAWSPIPLPWPKGKLPRQWTTSDDVRQELRGKNLACWCPLDRPCHADVLLGIANENATPLPTGKHGKLRTESGTVKRGHVWTRKGTDGHENGACIFNTCKR